MWDQLPAPSFQDHAPVSGGSLLQLSHVGNRTEDSSFQAQACLTAPSCAAGLLALAFAACLLGALRAYPAGSKDGKPARNPHVDNAKFLGMVLVCWSHIGPMVIHGHSYTFEAEDVIWFHMPLFAFLSGNFVRPFSPQVLLKTFVGLVMPLLFYIVFLYPPAETLQLRSFGWTGRFPYLEGSAWDVLTGPGPGYIIWFLRCLIIWRLLAMLVASQPVALQVAVAAFCGMVGVYCGPEKTLNPLNCGTFAYQRALLLYPFYCMGQHLDIQGLLDASPAPSRTTVLLTWTCLMSLIFLECQPKLWKAVTFGVFDVLDTSFGPFLRYSIPSGCANDYFLLWARYLGCLAYRTAWLLIFLFFGVPRDETWFSEAGSHTLYAYLLHQPFPRYVAFALPKLGELLGWERVLAMPELLKYLGFLLLAFFLNLYFVGVVYATSSKPVRGVFGVLIEPSWLLRLPGLSQVGRKDVD